VARPVKYVFVTGGVLSGLGKGIAAASIANLLKCCGYHVNLQKCDPYLNVDAGLLNPREHGECFVTRDGAETDLDLGHYERFIDQELTQASSLMQGRVLQTVINAERAGKYQGQTVQIIPHVMQTVQAFIADASQGVDIHIVEIGGTVGDYEAMVFIEAIREFGYKVGRENCLYVHVVYVPYLGASQEFKSKPAQNSIRDLRGLGIAPDVLMVRSEQMPPASLKSKLSLFGGLPESAIVCLPNAPTVYEVPLTLEQSGISHVMLNKLGLPDRAPDMKTWSAMVRRAKTMFGSTVSVGFIAKYLDNADTYLCVFEALKSAAWKHGVNLEVEWVDAHGLPDMSERARTRLLQRFDGILVPGGFGARGVEGKILAAGYALTHKVPYLGLCYGLQMAVIAAARGYGLTEAHTVEVNPKTPDPVIDIMHGQTGKQNSGGTMRLGDYVCEFIPGSQAATIYKSTRIVERHRHRWECNPKYVPDYESWGIRAVGTNPGTGLVEVIEGVDHPYFLASQFHPEFKSRPNRPHPLFDGFVAAAVAIAKKS